MFVKYNYLNVALLKKGYSLDYARHVLKVLDHSDYYEDDKIRIDKTVNGYSVKKSVLL